MSPRYNPNEVASQPLEEVVERAHDELRRLAIGPGREGGRRFTMHIPVQADDSDVTIADALRRQEERIARIEPELGQTEHLLRETIREKEIIAATVRRRDEMLEEFHAAIAPPGNRPGSYQLTAHARNVIAALIELVDLKEIKARIEASTITSAEYDELMKTYGERQPKAWARARALLGRGSP